ncbi:unnamed protein product, partial [Rotaria magnacalcarata]
MREKCKLENPRCRICLNSINDRQSHACSNNIRCAQCGGDHHSLSNLCEKVVEYRSQLKQQVDNALATGKLHRVEPQNRNHPVQFTMDAKEFPPLPSQSKGFTPWRVAVAQTPTNTKEKNEDTTRMLLEINKNVLDMKDYTHSMNEKLDRMKEKVSINAVDTELHHEALLKLLPTLVDIVKEFIWP